MDPSIDITSILQQAGARDERVMERLYPVVYDELRRIAQNQLRHERGDHTLQATALVNEAYLKLIDQTRVQWQNRSHFFAIASRAIRRILVDYARRRQSQKRGGEQQQIPLENVLNLPSTGISDGLVSLDEALARLGQDQPEKVRVVEMRVFAGLTSEEIAEVMGVSTRTVERHWQFARAWLFRELT